MAQRRTRRPRNGVPLWAKILALLLLVPMFGAVRLAYHIGGVSTALILVVLAVMLLIGIVAPLRRR